MLRIVTSCLNKFCLTQFLPWLFLGTEMLAFHASILTSQLTMVVFHLRRFVCLGSQLCLGELALPHRVRSALSFGIWGVGQREPVVNALQKRALVLLAFTRLT